MKQSSADAGITQILIALDVIAEMALAPHSAAEVAACEIKLRQIKSRTELILHFIEATRLPRTTVGNMQ